MKVSPFSYHAPRSLGEALALLAEYAPQNGSVLAGGQSLVPTMAFRLAQSAHLIDINVIPELATLKVGGDRLHTGACVRHAALNGDTAPGATGALVRKVYATSRIIQSARAVLSVTASTMPPPRPNGAA